MYNNEGHKHRWIIKSINRTEYWFECDNCGDEIMCKKRDFWDERYWIKRKVKYEEARDRIIARYRQEGELRKGYYDQIESNKAAIKKEESKTITLDKVLPAKEATLSNNWEDFEIVYSTAKPTLLERLKSWFLEKPTDYTKDI